MFVQRKRGVRYAGKVRSACHCVGRMFPEKAPDKTDCELVNTRDDCSAISHVDLNPACDPIKGHVACVRRVINLKNLRVNSGLAQLRLVL